jgi:NADH dehydrogenase
LAEMEDMSKAALRYYPELSNADVRWVLVEATEKILPEVGERMGLYAADQLRSRGIDVKLKTMLESCVDGVIRLSDGDSFESDTIVWTAGVKPSPMLAHTDIPRDKKGRVSCLPTLQVVDPDGGVVPGAWSAGDCAAVPDLTSREAGALCAPNAQHAVRQAKVLADNVVATLRGQAVREYRHHYRGSVASMGLHKGVAQVYGVKVHGWPAWFLHRTYHVSRVPSLNRKIRVLADWTLALFLRREVVALGGLHEPRAEFTDVTPHVDAPPSSSLPADQQQRVGTTINA